MDIINNSINGLTKTFSGVDTVDATTGAVTGSDITTGEHFWGMVVSNLATCVVTSKVTRKRVAQGQPAIAGLVL